MTRFASSLFVLLLLVTRVSSTAADAPTGTQESDSGITHGFLAFGAETYLVGSAGKVTWTYPANSRDGWLLPNGNVLLALSKGKDFPGGGAVEVTREGKVLWS